MTSEITISVIEDGKTHVISSRGEIIHEDDGGRTALKSGESLQRIPGYTAIVDSSDHKWFSTQLEAINHAEKLAEWWRGIEAGGQNRPVNVMVR